MASADSHFGESHGRRSSDAGQGRSGFLLGAYVLSPSRHEVDVILARATVLSTGGWQGVSVRRIPMSRRRTGSRWHQAGAKLANMEFIQFHPTCLFIPTRSRRWYQEALRGRWGSAASTGESFMERYHPMKSLAPRDVVARAIDAELKRSGRTM